MFNLISRLWTDDEGAIISTELILLLALLIFGIIPGLVALRNSAISAFTDLSNAMSAVAALNVGVDGIDVMGTGNNLSGNNIIGFANGFEIVQSYNTNGLTTMGNPPFAHSLSSVNVGGAAPQRRARYSGNAMTGFFKTKPSFA